MFESDCVRIREVVIDKAKQRKAGWWFCRMDRGRRWSNVYASGRLDNGTRHEAADAPSQPPIIDA